MSDYENLVDYEWLVDCEAGAILKELAAADRPLHSAASWLRKLVSAGRARLVLEQVELRQRARVKFAAAQRMFFTRRLLEQATDQWVAAYKAERFRACGSVADLCCGIGGDLMGLAATCDVVGVDRNPVAAILAKANAALAVTSPFSQQVACEVADVADWQPVDVDAWHVDPDRRAAAPRASHPAASSPPLGVIERLLSQRPAGAVKLAPAAVLPERQQQRCELEWISCRRACRQLVAWHGALTSWPGQRRATLLSHARPDAGGLPAEAVWGTYCGQPDVPLQVAASVGRFVFDPDPAVVAAHLTGALASHHQLAALAPRVAYLTGHAPVQDRLLAAFEVIDVLPLDRRQLAAYVASHRLGRLEIKKRGVAVDPHALGRQLKGHGDRDATLILAPAGGRQRAIVARRCL